MRIPTPWIVTFLLTLVEFLAAPLASAAEAETLNVCYSSIVEIACAPAT